MQPTDIVFNKKEKRYKAIKLDRDTTYYIGAAKICPICLKSIVGPSALSRKDNRTEICSQCGTIEALEVFMNYEKKKEK